MKRILPIALCALALAATPASAQLPDPPTGDGPMRMNAEARFGDFNALTRGAKIYEGLFKLYQKDDHVYMEIQPNQFDRPLLAPIAIARGATHGGETLNGDEQWVLAFRRVNDKIHLIRRNVRFKAAPGSPVHTAVETTYMDSVLMALKIHAINMQKNAPLIDLNEIFFTDFAELNMGRLDPSRTTWSKVKAFPKNIELEVAATYSGRERILSPIGHDASDAVIDSRGNTVVIHYGLLDLAADGYQARYADDRIGYFVTALKDFSSDSRDTSFVRYVNRWRLERIDGSPWKEGAKLVPPKKKIVFWIEKSVPTEYRTAVREGILEWNKAFEKIGFRDAIEVRQQESEDFDPEDITYATLRWTAHDQGYAIGPIRANPITGEILDADILFDASMVRYYKLDHQLFKNALGQWQEMPSPIEAARLGWNLPFARLPGSDVAPAGWNDRADPEAVLRERCRALRQGLCQCGGLKGQELSLAAAALLVRGPLEKGVPDELIQQAVKETVMHEVGHTLGLRHNFKGSTMLKAEQLHDLNVTRKQGLVGSVMDYNPVNLAPKGVKQGDYFTNTIGPYDYWAIEYGYKPIVGGFEGEIAELKKIASKSAQPGLDYGTDEDLFGTSDPMINQWDMGSDPLKFGMDRAKLAEELIKGLADRVVDNGDGYQRARQAFSIMLRQYADAAALASYHVGGENYFRDHKGDANGRDPLVTVKPAKQREALKFLQAQIFSDKPFNFPPELLRKMAADRWIHWGNESTAMTGVEFPLNERVLAIQRVALNRLLAGGTLTRIQNSAAKADKEDAPLNLAEVFRALTDSVWSDLPTLDKPAADKSSILRRNLQREHVKKLTALVLGRPSSLGSLDELLAMMRHGAGGNVPADARSLARLHLRDLGKRMDLALADQKSPLDDATKAHLEECKERIAKALTASLQASE
ncbi:MAG: zinc-dependent metalloprotease [Gemmataceae bacterium]